MNLGFVSAILPDLSLEEVLDFAAAEGFDCVELMCWPKGKAERRYAGVTHIDVTDLDKDDEEEATEAVQITVDERVAAMDLSDDVKALTGGEGLS